MAKKSRQFFSRKNRVTPLVAAPGDTNPSDAPLVSGMRICAGLSLGLLVSVCVPNLLHLCLIKVYFKLNQ